MMMKKCALLALCLLLVATAAQAGTTNELMHLNDEVSLVYMQPEGVASIDVADSNGMKVLTYTMEDASMPRYVLTISYSDLLHERDITDLTEAEIEQLVAVTAIESEAYRHEVVEMEDGWPAVLLLNEEGDSGSDWVDAFTLISGYLVQIHGYHPDDFRPLTEAEDRMALTLLDSVDIVETEA